MQKNESKQSREESPQGQGRRGEVYLDVRICCTCWGVSAKVKCASSNLWLEVDAEDTEAQSLPSPHPRSCSLLSHTADPTRGKPSGKDSILSQNLESLRDLRQPYRGWWAG